MNDKEVALRVATPGRAVAHRVLLWPQDTDWNCDCKSLEDPCEHVAAAIIAVRRAHEKGEALPQGDSSSVATIGYRLIVRDGALDFFRTTQIGQDPEERLVMSLVALATQSSHRLKVAPTKTDMAIELALGQEKEGIFSPKKWSVLAKHLAVAGNVRLDDLAIVFSDEAIGTIGIVEDEGPGIRIRGEKNPEITRIFENGVALCGSVLKAISDFGLTPVEVKMLAEGQRFGLRELPEFASVILPALRRKIPVRLVGRNIPEESDVAARVALQSTQEGNALRVQLAIIYGDPQIGVVIDGFYQAFDSSKVAVRNLAFEKKLLAAARTDLGLASDVGMFQGESAVRFVDKLGPWRGEVARGGVDQFTRKSGLVVNFSPTNTGFELAFTSPSGESQGPQRADTQRVFDAWRNGESLVRLVDGGWAPLPIQWLQLYGRQVADLLEARDLQGAVPPAAKMDLVNLTQDLGLVVPESLTAYARLLNHYDETNSTAISAFLEPLLRDYQKSGIRWIDSLAATESGGILADDMGLGKTVQAIGAMRGKTLVIAPISVLQNWAREIVKFRPEYKSCIYHGANRVFDRDVDVVISTYAILRLDQEILSSRRWDTIILDESQYIKNPESKAALAAYGLPGVLRLCLTGTPIENKLEELWSQFNFANPGLLGSRRFFQENYVQPVQDGNEVALARLRLRIKPFMLRRKKSDVALELPPKTTVVLNSELSTAERQLYDGILLATRKEVLESLAQGGSVIQALELLLRLRQASCHSGLVPGQTAETSSKLAVLTEILEVSVAAGHKTLIFSQWTSFLDRIESALHVAKISQLRIDGKTVDRQRIVDTFQNDSSVSTLLISLKAGGTGLNLTAADQVIIMDPWWNPFVEDQAADRAHRIGQTRPVLVQKIVAKDTVEERILNLQEIKRNLADSILSGADLPQQMTRDDLISILS
jgi:superfamily II DNA or RNA helicase